MVKKNGNGTQPPAGTRWITDPVSSQSGCCLDRPDFNKERAPDREDQRIQDHKIPLNAPAMNSGNHLCAEDKFYDSLGRQMHAMARKS